MQFSPKYLALFLSFCIALITTLFVSLVEGVTATALLVCFSLAFASGFLLIILSLDFLIFREINALQDSFNKIKKKDFKLAKRRLATLTATPLQTLNEQIFDYAEKKQQEIDQLMQVEAFRREFLADVSHELKTPIFAAQGFIHTLLDGAVDDAEVRYKFLERAAKTLDGLDHLVQDLITLSKMESGSIKMKLSPCYLHEIIEEVLEQLEDKALEKSIKLHKEIKSDSAVQVLADRQRIKQVLINLVENGIKYGKIGGQVEILLSCEKDNCRITVKDDGLGIPKKHQSRIFERFYRVEKSRSKEQGGSGLGLAIVKQIVEAHQSEIEVQSKVDKGTVFSFSLKRHHSNASLAAEESEKATRKRNK